MKTLLMIDIKKTTLVVIINTKIVPQKNITITYPAVSEHAQICICRLYKVHMSSTELSYNPSLKHRSIQTLWTPQTAHCNRSEHNNYLLTMFLNHQIVYIYRVFLLTVLFSGACILVCLLSEHWCTNDPPL